MSCIRSRLCTPSTHLDDLEVEAEERVARRMGERRKRSILERFAYDLAVTKWDTKHRDGQAANRIFEQMFGNFLDKRVYIRREVLGAIPMRKTE